MYDIWNNVYSLPVLHFDIRTTAVYNDTEVDLCLFSKLKV